MRVVAAGDPSVNPFAVRELKSPVSPIAHSQGFLFAKPDKAVFKKAFAGADLCIFCCPCPLRRVRINIFARWTSPCRRHFICSLRILHLSRTPIGALPWPRESINSLIVFYQYFTLIHCPSQFIADQLKINGYAAKTHVISNGVDDDFGAGYSVP